MQSLTPFVFFKIQEGKSFQVCIEKLGDDKDDSSHLIFSVPPKAGEGEIHFAELNCGTRIFILDAVFSETVRFDFYYNKKALTFCINPNYENPDNNFKGPKCRECLIEYNPVDYSSYEFRPGSKIGMILVCPMPEFIQSFVNNSDLNRILKLESIIKSNETESFAYRVQSSSMTRVLVDKIVNSPYNGFLKRVFIETAVMEIISLHLNCLIDKPALALKKSVLRNDDYERIALARDILIRKISNPPSICDLACEAGINEFKLKKGFREIFGMTVYEYLRAVRLDHACFLLSSTDKTVTEVALETGYANPSHFAQLFKRKIGINPKEYSTGISELAERS